MTGAQFEIRMRSYRDRRDFAVEAATSPDQGFSGVCIQARRSAAHNTRMPGQSSASLTDLPGWRISCLAPSRLAP